VRESSSMQFDRAPLWAGLDALYALAGLAIAVSSWLRDDTVLAALCGALAIVYATESVWATRTPYAFLDPEGIRVRDRLLFPWRHLSWSQVAGLETRGSRLLLLHSGRPFSIQLSWVRTQQRDDLVAEVERHVGAAQ